MLKSFWDHSGKPSVFVVTESGKEIYRGSFKEQTCGNRILPMVWINIHVGIAGLCFSITKEKLRYNATGYSSRLEIDE